MKLFVDALLIVLLFGQTNCACKDTIKKMNKRLFYLLFYSTSDKIIFHSFPVLFFYFLILSFYSLSILCFLNIYPFRIS